MLEITQINFSFTLRGSWYAHQVEIDATEGIYDWTKRKLLVSNQPGEFQFVIKDIDFNGGQLVQYPPGIENNLNRSQAMADVVIGMLVIDGLPVHDLEAIPDISKHVRADDLETIIPNLDMEWVTSRN